MTRGLRLMLALTVMLINAAGSVRAFATATDSRSELPVIVGVQASFVPEGYLSDPEAAASQRADIARAQAAVESALAGYHAVNLRRFEHIPYLAMRVDQAALDVLRASPWVTSIQEDVPERVTLAQSTNLIGAATPGTGVWAQGYTGAGQSIAVLDTGVERSHPFLSGRVVAEGCFSNLGSNTPFTGPGYTSSTVCPNGQGTMTGVDAARPCNAANPDSTRSCDHGTHVAGIAAGRAYAGIEAATPSGSAYSGIAPEATLIAVQVFSRFDGTFCGADGQGNSLSPCYATWPSDQLAALDFVYGLRTSFNIAAVNMSLGGSTPYPNPCDSDARKSMIDLLRSVGIATVVSSGNNGSASGLTTPACISSAISVGSTRDGGADASPADTISGFSNSAWYLSLLAPGERIESSVPLYNAFDYEPMNGTSMATPHVAGAWAVLQQAQPAASVDEVLSALQASGAPLTDPRNSDTKSRLQLNAALDLLMPVRFKEGAAYSFGTVGVDLIATHTFTLRNASSSPATSLAPTLTGQGLVYAGGGSYPGAGGTCGFSLGPGETCTITLAYAPTSAGNLDGALIIDSTINGEARQVRLALSGSARAVCTINLLANAHFEAYLNTAWQQSDSVSGDALPLTKCGPSGCGATTGSLGPAGPDDGLGWAWFGGYTTTVPATLAQSVGQPVTIPPGTATLQFWFSISRADAGASAADVFQALMDGVPVFTATAAEQSAYASYRLVRVGINSFADGGGHTLAFASTTTTGAVINFNLDGVAVCSPAFYPLYFPIVAHE